MREPAVIVSKNRFGPERSSGSGLRIRNAAADSGFGSQRGSSATPPSAGTSRIPSAPTRGSAKTCTVSSAGGTTAAIATW
jgi:hypothetical protein